MAGRPGRSARWLTPVDSLSSSKECSSWKGAIFFNFHHQDRPRKVWLLGQRTKEGATTRSQPEKLRPSFGFASGGGHDLLGFVL